MHKKKRRHVYLSQETDARLQEMAKQYERPFTWIVEQACKMYLDALEVRDQVHGKGKP